MKLLLFPIPAVATVSAILATGATPILVDIETDFYTLDPDKHVTLQRKPKQLLQFIFMDNHAILRKYVISAKIKILNLLRMFLKLMDLITSMVN